MSRLRVAPEKNGWCVLIEKQVEGVSYYEFPHFSEIAGLRHGVFTRKGGHSRGPYASLNVGRSVGDSPEAVEKNRLAVRRVLADASLIFIHQVHGSDVVVFEGHSPEMPPIIPPVGDAVITNVPGAHLVIQAADCQSVMLVDPVHNAIANIHSGWRGSIQNIIGRTVEKMAEVFGSRACDLLAGIGPSLGPCCAQFIHYQTEIPETLWPYRTHSCYFDFWAISRNQLQAEGVMEHNIHQSNLCTRCRTDLFFSYRAEKNTGRFAAVIGLTGVTD